MLTNVKENIFNQSMTQAYGSEEIPSAPNVTGVEAVTFQ